VLLLVVEVDSIWSLMVAINCSKTLPKLVPIFGMKGRWGWDGVRVSKE
jgi:hypothetical protein